MMTPEEKRIAIALACGWTPRKAELMGNIYTWNTPEGDMVREAGLPDYLNDLNAMHEAEKVLTKDQCFYYRDEIQNAVLKTIAYWSADFVFGATAAQRADAFIKVITSK